MAARPVAETLERRLSRPFAVVPVASAAIGGRPAARVAAETRPAPRTSKRTSGASRGPVTRAVPLTVPPSPSCGRMVLAMSSGRSRIATSTSKLSATLPWAVRPPFPTWSASGVSSTAPPRMVTVAGAVRVAEARSWRMRSVSSVAAKPSSRRASSPEKSASVPMARRASAEKRIVVPSVCSAVALSAASSNPATARSRAASVPSISGRPRASATLALASSAPMRFAPTARSLALAVKATPWPGSEALSVMSASTAPLRVGQRQRGDRRDVGRVEREPALDRGGAALRELARQAVRADGEVEAGERAVVAGDGEVGGKPHHQPVERAAAGERAGDVGAVDLAGEAEPGAGEAAADELALGDARREGDVDRAALAGGAALDAEPARGARVEEGEIAEGGLEADVGLRAGDLAVRGEGELRVGEAQVLGAEARRVADGAAGEGGRARHQPVEALIAEREVAGLPVEAEVEAAAQRADAAVGVQVDRAAEVASGEAGENGEVGDRGSRSSR